VGDAHGAQAAAALASRPATSRRGSSSRDAGECWSLRLTPDERRTLSEELDALTDREREVALAICDGGSNEVVAERLYIALPTLRTHLMRINQKLGTRSKGDVVRLMVGRLLDGYRSGRVANGARPGGPAPELNGSPSPAREAMNGRMYEAKPSSPPAPPASPTPQTTSGPGETPERSGQSARPGLARPKIIDTDDDSRLSPARMAGSL
jgi:DNA-binding CsgD family transcriptional regulator